MLGDDSCSPCPPIHLGASTNFDVIPVESDLWRMTGAWKLSRARVSFRRLCLESPFIPANAADYASSVAEQATRRAIAPFGRSKPEHAQACSAALMRSPRSARPHSMRRPFSSTSANRPSRKRVSLICTRASVGVTEAGRRRR
jgi:hypothetical protein